MEYISNWFRRRLSDRQLVILTVVIISIAAAIYFAGDKLAPVFAAIIIAYLLQGAINRLGRFNIPSNAGFWIVFSSFTLALLVLMFGLLPLLIREVGSLVQQAPSMMSTARRLLGQLPVNYPELVNEQQINDLIASVGGSLVGMSQNIVSYSVNSLVALITFLVYFILVPFMVFFLVRDKERVVHWASGFLPRERHLTNQVWAEVNGQIDNYIQGKVWEILIVGGVSYIVFKAFGLQYSALLAAITGLSVLVPYIGAAVVTIPIAFVAFFQWGWTPHFWSLVVAYLVIQLLDGNLLVPILFGEAVKLHPVAIIVAVLFFGGMWGFWGVFFAIPLATVVNAVLRAMPGPDQTTGNDGEPDEQGTSEETI